MKTLGWIAKDSDNAVFFYSVKPTFKSNDHGDTWWYIPHTTGIESEMPKEYADIVGFTETIQMEMIIRKPTCVCKE